MGFKPGGTVTPTVEAGGPDFQGLSVSAAGFLSGLIGCLGHGTPHGSRLLALPSRLAFLQGSCSTLQFFLPLDERWSLSCHSGFSFPRKCSSPGAAQQIYPQGRARNPPSTWAADC